MDWRYKAIVQNVLSHLPSGQRANYLLQRRLTKSFPIAEATFRDLVTWCEPHIKAIRRHHAAPLSQLRFYEFGAGYHLIGPLTFYALGVDQQLAVDLNRLTRPELINDTIVKFCDLPVELGLELVRKPSQLVDEKNPSLSLKELYGIEYRAPCDARATGLPSNSIDCVTSTSTLEHISPADIRAILWECHRLLKPDGMMTMAIDYQDHYSFFDKNISGYNFLRYSDSKWEMFSPSLHFQNRLRHPDYVALFESCGFQIIEEKRSEGTAADVDTIKRLPLNEKFAAYELNDLVVRGGFFALSKAEGTGSLRRRSSASPRAS
jgi:SAM-dependent methyltransferase